MLEYILIPLRFFTILVVVSLATMFLGTMVILTAIPKLLFPFKSARLFINSINESLCRIWIKIINSLFLILPKIDFEIIGAENLSTSKSYMIICNHQSWVDIIFLLKSVALKVPFLRFFIKQNLIWLPFAGQACWAMDFPFMKRYSREYIEKYPEKKGKDLIATKKFCERLTEHPVSIVNFIEGTRFTKAKHNKQNSPYKHLLKPKAGGISYVLEAIGNRLDSLLNITIVYPDKIPSTVELMCGKIKTVKVIIEELPIPMDLINESSQDPKAKQKFHSWLNKIWEEKDRIIEKNK